MIRRLFGIIIVVTAIIIGLGIYLSPDDLASCRQPENNCKKAEAIVAISGGDTSARTNEAISLYKDGWAPLLIVSGAAADKTGISNAAAMKKQALDQGVPEGAILAEETSETTKQNAIQVAEIIQQRGLRRIILVTSGYHMRRAKLEFAAQLPDLDIVAHPVTKDKQWGNWWWLTPWGWWLALGELVKIIVFAAGGLS